ncbi:hypothetical protein EDD21DRAFT_391081 [Dissophora ornata]|nr:hypothetical protein EDD21DRAFT_391081 [Dissophora ornata]
MTMSRFDNTPALMNILCWGVLSVASFSLGWVPSAVSRFCLHGHVHFTCARGALCVHSVFDLRQNIAGGDWPWSFLPACPSTFRAHLCMHGRVFCCTTPPTESERERERERERGRGPANAISAPLSPPCAPAQSRL